MAVTREMAKNKETKKVPCDITKALDDVRKRNHKKVLYKNKYFNNETRHKADLIKTLLQEKKKVLKLNQSTDDDLNSEDENKIHEDEISRVLEREKESIFSNNESDDESVPVEILEANKKWKEQQKPKLIFPAIPRKEINALLNILSSDKSFNSYEKNLHDCVSHLHSPVKPFWNSPSCIMKVVKDCILRRKWNNLTSIILMLIHLRIANMRPLIKHLCQILNKLHPVIEHAGLQDQLNIVHEANKSN